MERKEALSWLKIMKAQITTFGAISQNKKTEALSMAISSLETDEAYQLEYENPEFCADCISREAVKEILPKMAFTSSEKYIQALSKIELLPSIYPKSELANNSPRVAKEIGECEVENCVSRAEVLKLMRDNWHTHDGDWAMQESMDDIRALPSVTPQEPKTGHWISTETKGVRYAFWCRYKCSICGGLSDRTNFCPNCGAFCGGDNNG